LAGAAGAAGGSFVNQQTSLSGLQGKSEERVSITPSDAACSVESDNCFWTGCCKTTGHKCYRKHEGFAKCNKTCTPGKQGFTNCEEVSQPSVPVKEDLGTSLYCIAVYTANTGSTKPSTELELLTLQRKYDASIFGCEAQDVFADVEVSLGKGTTTLKVEDLLNEFHVLKRKGTGSWVNWGMFYQVWMKVRDVGKWYNHDYFIKVDPDAVFLPARMRSWLQGRKDTDHGVYYENCKNVQMGFFGNLEVLTKRAIAALLGNLEDCHEVYAPCANDGCDWKYGPWGEDVWMQRCMDRHFVDKVEAFDETTDGACEADRPEGQKKNKKWHAEDCSRVITAAVHPFKKPTEYFKCLGEIMQREYEV